ncbi:MAG: CopD family protein [Rhodospirillales bacterium]|nr:CopD family protein [Rhodospirillales bacterium]
MDMLLFPVVSTLHTLAAVVWVGGMFFAHLILRPTLMTEEPATRLGVWSRIFPRFFAWVWIAVGILPASGYAMVFVDFGGFAAAGRHVEVMHGLSWVMTALFVFLFFKPYPALQAAVANKDWALGAKHLATIRRIVTINLSLGVLVIIAGVSGRFWG